jgi:hypothetical protein
MSYNILVVRLAYQQTELTLTGQRICLHKAVIKMEMLNAHGVRIGDHSTAS